MILFEAYLKAIEAVGRPRHNFDPVFPVGWKETDKPVAMLVLVGGRAFKSADWPAPAFVLGRGTYAIGNSIPGAAFPRSREMPRIFEGHQCLLEVGDEVRLTKDVSTNGTYVVSPTIEQGVPPAGEGAAVRKETCRDHPITIRPNDIILTMYADLLLVRL